MPQKIWYGIVRMIMRSKLFHQLFRITFFIAVATAALLFAAKDKYALRDISTRLSVLNPVLKKTRLGELVGTFPENQQKIEYPTEPQISTQSLYNFIDAERHKNNLTSLKSNQFTAAIAQRIADESAALGENFAQLDTNKIVSEIATQYKLNGYSFSHDTLLGVHAADEAIAQWLTHAEAVRYLDPELEAVAVATATAKLQGTATGVVVSVFSKKISASADPPTQPKPKKSEAIVFPAISNESVLAALNAYRSVHGVGPLQEHPNLCAYAEKRLQDLLTFGGLDNHAGFKKDFENMDAIPQIIKDYPGNNVGENLAYQFCRNMKTDEAFIAPHATALIEWCFDSSTKGHREAQLNNEYVSACSRNKNGYFVIIFGD